MNSQNSYRGEGPKLDCFAKLKWKKKPSSGKPRIHFLDEVRGFAVLCMVFYHGFFTFSTLFGFAWGATLLRFFQPAEPVFAGLFVFLSGIAANLTHSNLIRGLKLAVVALAVSAVTFLVTPNQPIYFGVLHLLSVAMILTGLILPFLNRVPIWPGIILCAAIVAFTCNIWEGYLGFFSIPLIDLPRFLYRTDWFLWMGTYSSTFFSADYFPLFPWLFVFLGGVFFGRYARDGKFPKWTYRSHVPPLSFLGRHALIIYIVHQPVFYGIGLITQLF